jgi:aminoglycoside phosphotransferase (APT) family kinase protein
VKHVLHEVVPGLGPGEARVRGRRSTCTVLRYKPERRAVVRVEAGIRDARTGEKETRRFAVRAYADDRGAATLEALRRLEAAGVPVPPPLGYHADRRVLVCGWREGICFADLLGNGLAEDSLGSVGELLVRVREVPFDRSAPVRSATDIIREASIVLGDLLQVGGGAVRERGMQVLSQLGHLASHESFPARPSIVHGDLHHRQILVGGETEVAIVDWDETAVGDPREDVANLVAHLELLVLENRLEAGLAERLEARFLEAAGLPEARSLVAPQLVKLATVPFRNLGQDWQSESLAILERALHRMRRPEHAR